MCFTTTMSQYKGGSIMRIKIYSVMALVLLLAGACGSKSSDIVVEKAWARPAVAVSMGEMGDMEATEEAGMGDMETAQEATGMEMASGGANMTGAFMVIKNKGGAADKLIGAECAAAGVVEIHETRIENYIASMSPVESIEIPANSTVELRPGSYHVMLLDLKQDLVAGQTVAIKLKFESGKTVDVEAAIQEQAP